MGVQDAVARLAEAVEDSGLCATPRERLVAGLLKLMPLYGAAGRLDLWESHARAATDDIGKGWPSSRCEDALDGIYEFGRYNLYGQFDADGTATELAQLRSRLARLGVAPPPLGAGATSEW